MRHLDRSQRHLGSHEGKKQNTSNQNQFRGALRFQGYQIPFFEIKKRKGKIMSFELSNWINVSLDSHLFSFHPGKSCMISHVHSNIRKVRGTLFNYLLSDTNSPG
jgi:hypothetical protein